MSDTQLNYCIPKVKRSPSEGCRNKTLPASRNYHEILQIIKDSFLTSNYGLEKKWNILSVDQVINEDFQKSFQNKRQELRELNLDIDERFAFAIVDTEEKANDACQNGNYSSHEMLTSVTLGKKTDGVHVWMNADLPLRWAAYNNVTPYLIIYKVMRGRKKQITPAVNSSVEPSPNFECHVSREPLKIGGKLNQLISYHQIFVYEYDEECLPSKHPRHCHPYAVVACASKAQLSSVKPDTSKAALKSKSRKNATKSVKTLKENRKTIIDPPEFIVIDEYVSETSANEASSDDEQSKPTIICHSEQKEKTIRLKEKISKLTNMVNSLRNGKTNNRLNRKDNTSKECVAGVVKKKICVKKEANEDKLKLKRNRSKAYKCKLIRNRARWRRRKYKFKRVSSTNSLRNVAADELVEDFGLAAEYSAACKIKESVEDEGTKWQSMVTDKALVEYDMNNDALKCYSSEHTIQNVSVENADEKITNILDTSISNSNPQVFEYNHSQVNSIDYKHGRIGFQPPYNCSETCVNSWNLPPQTNAIHTEISCLVDNSTQPLPSTCSNYFYSTESNLELMDMDISSPEPNVVTHNNVDTFCSSEDDLSFSDTARWHEKCDNLKNCVNVYQDKNGRLHVQYSSKDEQEQQSSISSEFISGEQENISHKSEVEMSSFIEKGNNLQPQKFSKDLKRKRKHSKVFHGNKLLIEHSNPRKILLETPDGIEKPKDPRKILKDPRKVASAKKGSIFRVLTWSEKYSPPASMHTPKIDSSELSVYNNNYIVSNTKESPTLTEKCLTEQDNRLSVLKKKHNCVPKHNSPIFSSEMKFESELNKPFRKNFPKQSLNQSIIGLPRKTKEDRLSLEEKYPKKKDDTVLRDKSAYSSNPVTIEGLHKPVTDKVSPKHFESKACHIPNESKIINEVSKKNETSLLPVVNNEKNKQNSLMEPILLPPDKVITSRRRISEVPHTQTSKVASLKQVTTKPSNEREQVPIKNVSGIAKEPKKNLQLIMKTPKEEDGNLQIKKHLVSPEKTDFSHSSTNVDCQQLLTNSTLSDPLKPLVETSQKSYTANKKINKLSKITENDLSANGLKENDHHLSKKSPHQSQSVLSDKATTSLDTIKKYIHDPKSKISLSSDSSQKKSQNQHKEDNSGSSKDSGEGSSYYNSGEDNHQRESLKHSNEVDGKCKKDRKTKRKKSISSAPTACNNDHNDALISKDQLLEILSRLEDGKGRKKKITVNVYNICSDCGVKKNHHIKIETESDDSSDTPVSDPESMEINIAEKSSLSQIARKENHEICEKPQVTDIDSKEVNMTDQSSLRNKINCQELNKKRIHEMKSPERDLEFMQINRTEKLSHEVENQEFKKKNHKMYEKTPLADLESMEVSTAEESSHSNEEEDKEVKMEILEMCTEPPNTNLNIVTNITEELPCSQVVNQKIKKRIHEVNPPPDFNSMQINMANKLPRSNEEKSREGKNISEMEPLASDIESIQINITEKLSHIDEVDSQEINKGNNEMCNKIQATNLESMEMNMKEQSPHSHEVEGQEVKLLILKMSEEPPDASDGSMVMNMTEKLPYINEVGSLETKTPLKSMEMNLKLSHQNEEECTKFVEGIREICIEPPATDLELMHRNVKNILSHSNEVKSLEGKKEFNEPATDFEHMDMNVTEKLSHSKDIESIVVKKCTNETSSTNEDENGPTLNDHQNTEQKPESSASTKDRNSDYSCRPFHRSAASVSATEQIKNQHEHVKTSKHCWDTNTISKADVRSNKDSCTRHKISSNIEQSKIKYNDNLQCHDKQACPWKRLPEDLPVLNPWRGNNFSKKQSNSETGAHARTTYSKDMQRPLEVNLQGNETDLRYRLEKRRKRRSSDGSSKSPKLRKNSERRPESNIVKMKSSIQKADNSHRKMKDSEYRKGSHNKRPAAERMDKPVNYRDSSGGGRSQYLRGNSFQSIDYNHKRASFESSTFQSKDYNHKRAFFESSNFKSKDYNHKRASFESSTAARPYGEYRYEDHYPDEDWFQPGSRNARWEDRDYPNHDYASFVAECKSQGMYYDRCKREYDHEQYEWQYFHMSRS